MAPVTSPDRVACALGAWVHSTRGASALHLRSRPGIVQALVVRSLRRFSHEMLDV